MGHEHAGLSPDEIALLAETGNDGAGAPAELESERANAAALAASTEDAAAAAVAQVAADARGRQEPNESTDPTDDVAPAPVAATSAPAAAEPPAEAPAAAPVAQPAPAPFVPKYEAVDLAAMDAKRADLIARDEAAFKKLNDGEIDTDEFLTTQREVRAELDTLLIKRTLAEANQQTEAQLQQQAQQTEMQHIEGLMASAKAAGTIDYYSDKAAQTLIDWAITAAQNDPDNAGKTFSELLQQAHAAVLQRRGVNAAAAPVPTPAPAPAPAPVAAIAKNDPRAVDLSKIPPTLSRVPPAVDPNVAGDEFSHLAALSGVDLEKAVAGMTAEQQERWLN